MSREAPGCLMIPINILGVVVFGYVVGLYLKLENYEDSKKHTQVDLFPTVVATAVYHNAVDTPTPFPEPVLETVRGVEPQSREEIQARLAAYPNQAVFTVIRDDGKRLQVIKQHGIYIINYPPGYTRGIFDADRVLERTIIRVE